MRPLAAAATALPPVAFRQDAGAAITALLRYAPQLLSGGTAALQLTGPFSKVSIVVCTSWSACADCEQSLSRLNSVPQATGKALLTIHCLGECLPSLLPLLVQVLDAAGVKDPFIRNWLDLLSFLLSGLPADGTIAGGGSWGRARES